MYLHTKNIPSIYNNNYIFPFFLFIKIAFLLTNNQYISGINDLIK